MSFAELTGEFFSSLLGRGDAAQATISAILGACLAGLTCGALGSFIIPVSYTHLTLPTTPYV